MELVNYFIENYQIILSYFIEHANMTLISVSLAILIGVPFGIIICYVEALKKPVLGLANIIQSVPSMAILGLAIPFLGIGSIPAIIMVVLYSLLPIIKNTAIGISNINADTIEAAKGIGLTRQQRLFKVQIPLAMPTIMAGIRISAVTSVGLMTIAAFVGGGGLGFLVFSGIRTMNNYQILSGAIPACILALLVDYAMATLEGIMVPKGISVNKKTPNKIHRYILVILISGLIINFVYSYWPKSTNKDTIIIAGKDYTEQEVLVHLLAQAIEGRSDLKVIKKPLLGSSLVIFQAMQRGDVDAYIEYTGTAYSDILKYPLDGKEPDAIYEIVKKDFMDKYNINILQPFNFNNTYTIATTKEIASKYNLEKIGDIQTYDQDLIIGTTLEFLNRKDGLPGLKEHYNLKFKEEIGIDGNNRYTAVLNNKTQLVDAFSTDALIKKLDLVVLKDDQNFFPPYYAIPTVRKEITDKYPELEVILFELGTYLDEKTMIELNYQVDELSKPASTVAKEFLESINWNK